MDAGMARTQRNVNILLRSVQTAQGLEVTTNTRVKVREISIEGPTYGIMKLADLTWTEFYSRPDQTVSKRPSSVVKFIQPSKKVVPNTNVPGNGQDSYTGTRKNKGNKGGGRGGQKNKHVQGTDGHKNHANTCGTLDNNSIQAAEPHKPKYKETKDCAEADCSWRMTQRELNGRWNGTHAEK
ncbi:hypothetical protein SARC_17595, partial [Sphaeroforma arctica JP610]